MKKSVAFILTAVTVFICIYAVRYLDKPVETITARLNEYEESTAADAYFVRKEAVYESKASGTFYTYAREGARVGKDRLIAAVYNGIVDAQSLQEINNLNKKITELEEYDKNNSFSKDDSDSETRLKNLKNEILTAVESNKVSEISKIKKSIKSVVSGEDVDGGGESAEELERRKNAIEASLGHSKSDIYSDCSGVFSTNIDGLENELTVDKLDTYTLSDFDAVGEKAAESGAKTTALSSEAVCKVIDNHVWYVFSKVKTEIASGFEKGQRVTLRFDSIPGVEAEASIMRTDISEDSEYSIVIFECEKYIEGIFSIRQSSLEIISEEYSGFKIPISAVRVRDGQQGVMIRYGINEIFKPCEVIYTDRENDTVIIKPVTEGVTNPLEQFDKIVIGEKTEQT